MIDIKILAISQKISQVSTVRQNRILSQTRLDRKIIQEILDVTPQGKGEYFFANGLYLHCRHLSTRSFTPLVQSKNDTRFIALIVLHCNIIIGIKQAIL